MNEKLRVLFVCVHNSARSQMAEAFLNRYGGDKFYSESAGLEIGRQINPLVIELMKEEGIDLSDKKTNYVFDYYKEGRQYDFVVTVCDESQGERCPLFPAQSKSITRLHWSFADPSSFTGTYEEKLEKTRIVRNEIKRRIIEFINVEGNRLN
jgi:arsenate reductase